MRKLLIIVFLLLFASPAFCVTFYVDGSVESSGNGTSWATAKKTITEGIALLSTTGDIVEISGGSSGLTYTEYIDISSINGGASYYTIKGSSESSHNGTVTLANYSTSAYNIFIHGTSLYLKIQNMTLLTDSSNESAIRVQGCDYCEVSSITISGTSAGAGEYAAIQFYNSTNNSILNNNVTGGGFDVGIDSNGDTYIARGDLIEGNIVTNFYYAGIKIRNNSSGSIIRKNYISGPPADTTNTMIFLLRSSHYALIENNVGVFTKSGSLYQHFIEARGQTGCLGPDSSNNTFQNNTFIADDAAKSAINFADDSSNNVFQNNIFQGSFVNFSTCWDVGCGRPGNVVRNNIVTGAITSWHECSDESIGMTHDNNQVSTTPNWRLSGNKPFPYWSLTAGDSYGTGSSSNGFSVPTTDYSGYSRASIPDVGAFEYEGLTSVQGLTIQGGTLK